MKLVLINMDCLLQFDALTFFLEVHLHGRSQPNFNFFKANPQISLRNRNDHITSCLETNFHDISVISLRVIRRRNYSYCKVLRGKKKVLNISDMDEINILFI